MILNNINPNGSIAELIDRGMRRFLEARPREHYLGMSQLHLGHEALVKLLVHGEEEVESAALHRLFVLGHILEEAYCSFLEDRIVPGSRNAQVVLAEDSRCRGHVDGLVYLEHGKVAVLEVKTKGHAAWEALGPAERSFGEDADEVFIGILPRERKQVQMYMAALGLPSAVILYVNRDTGQARTAFVPEDPMMQAVLKRKALNVLSAYDKAEGAKKAISPHGASALLFP